MTIMNCDKEVIDKAGIDKKTRTQIYRHVGRSDYLNG